jgi:hypothetical protein
MLLKIHPKKINLTKLLNHLILIYLKENLIPILHLLLYLNLRLKNKKKKKLMILLLQFQVQEQVQNRYQVFLQVNQDEMIKEFSQVYLLWVDF